MGNAKIVTLEDLAGIVESARGNGKAVVHCHGVFDLLHIGHIRYFEKAREMGDILVVTVTPDRYVNKGPGRPAFGEDLRAEAIASLGVVDHVSLNKWPTAVETLKLIKPDLYVKGQEYRNADDDHTGGIVIEKDAVESVGGRMAFTDDIVFSSSSLINKYAPTLPDNVTEYLEKFASRHDSAEVVGYLKSASALKVLVLGEAIVDEYEYCEAIGKSSKAPTLAVKSLYAKKFAGGTLAVANHVANFAEDVGLLTFLGDTDSEEDFIRQNLNQRITTGFLYRRGSPTIVKKRLIEHYFFTKMLEVYKINDDELDVADNSALCERLEEEVARHDVVIVVDFGHSMMTKDAVDIVTSGAKFLAVNAQANAGNLGYNFISKYPRADYATLAEKEVRLEARGPRGDLRRIVEDMSKRLDYSRIVVTRGSHGCLCYSRDEGFVEMPSVAHGVVDRVGAGDAFLSVSALCAAQGAPLEVVGFVGNAVGAWAVNTVCNEEAAARATLIKQIETLMKW